MSEWFVEIGSEGQLATWLVASLLLYILVSQLAWQYRYPGRDDPLGRWIDRVREAYFVPWAEEAIRFIYYLGIPFTAAVNGLLRADLLGISGTDWIDGASAQGFLWEDWAQGTGLATAAVLGMLAVWAAGRLVSRRAGLRLLRSGIPGPLWQRLLGVLYCQIHWAFYRSGNILWLDDVYWGAFAGLALILLEIGLNPAFWWELKSPQTAGPLLIRLGAAWISTLVFLATQNLWLTAAAHLALVGMLGEMRAESDC